MTTDSRWLRGMVSAQLITTTLLAAPWAAAQA
jgi:hypothetical protein